MYEKIIQPQPAIPKATNEQGGIYLNAIRFVMGSNEVNAETTAGLVLQELDGYASDYLAGQVRDVGKQLISIDANKLLNWSLAWAY